MAQQTRSPGSISQGTLSHPAGNSHYESYTIWYSEIIDYSTAEIKFVRESESNVIIHEIFFRIVLDCRLNFIYIESVMNFCTLRLKFAS